MTSRSIPAIYVDSCCIIDLVKFKRNVTLEDGRFNECWFLERIMDASRLGEVRLITSVISVVECLHANEPNPQPEETRQLFRDFLMSGVLIELVSVDPFIAERARDLRWEDNSKIRYADALHLATSLIERCSEFFTTDAKLVSKYAPLEQGLRGQGVSLIVPSKTGHLPQENNSADFFDPAAKPD